MIFIKYLFIISSVEDAYKIISRAYADDLEIISLACSTIIGQKITDILRKKIYSGHQKFIFIVSGFYTFLVVNRLSV